MEMSKSMFVYLGKLIRDVSSHIRPIMFDGTEGAQPQNGGFEEGSIEAMLQSELWWKSLSCSAMTACVRRHMHRIPLDVAKRAADFFASPNSTLMLDAFAKCVCAASCDTWVVEPGARVSETSKMCHGDAGIDLLATTAAQTNRYF
jgi:hypothetical protein